MTQVTVETYERGRLVGSRQEQAAEPEEPTVLDRIADVEAAWAGDRAAQARVSERGGAPVDGTI